MRNAINCDSLWWADCLEIATNSLVALVALVALDSLVVLVALDSLVALVALVTLGDPGT